MIEILWPTVVKIVSYLVTAGLKDSAVGGSSIDINTGQAIPRTVTNSSNPGTFHNPNNVMANMETLLESMNTGNWQNFDISQWQSLMESMKDIELQNLGLDTHQWQELAFSFSQYLQSQGIMRDNGSPGGASLGSHSNSLQVNSPQYSNGSSPLQGSHTSYCSSSSYGSTHSVPNIRVTPAMPHRPQPNLEEDEEEETFDWDSIM